MSLNVIALGGNAIVEKDSTDQGQKETVRDAAKNIADYIASGEDVVICHGNGPQVGSLLLQQESTTKVPAFKLDTCVAMTQGSIGYWIQNALHNEFIQRGINKSPISLVTQVIVNKNDKNFDNPTKPIGPFYTKEEANEKENQDGGVYKEDSGRGYRKYVASPKPISILENNSITEMVNLGIVPICAGGGGIPVILEEDDNLIGVEAVIDKDLAAKVLALDIKADNLIILTGVEYIYVNFNTPEQKALKEVTIEEMEKHIADNQFAEGSMLPKVEAAIDFVKKNPKGKAIITSLEQLKNIKNGVGTIITNKKTQ